MKLRSLVLGSLAAIVGMTLTGVALAGPGGGGAGGGSAGGPAGGPGRQLGRAIDAAGLDADRAKQVRAILTAAREAHRPLRDNIRDAREQLADLLGADPVDPGAVTAKARELGDLLGNVQVTRAATMLQVRDLVSAEEWKSLSKALLEQGPKRRGGGQRD